MVMTKVALFAASILLVLSACTGDADRGAQVRTTPTATVSPPGDTIWSDLAVGPPPELPYVSGRRYVTPQGKDALLPVSRRGVSGVVPFAGGLLVSDAGYFEGSNGVDLVRRGARVKSWPSGRHCSSGVPVASPDGRYVAWVTVWCPESEDRTVGAVHRARADGSGEVTQPVGAELVHVVGFLGRKVVYDRGFQDVAWITDFRDDPSRIPGVESVLAVNQRTDWFIGRRGNAPRVVVDADGMVHLRIRAGYLVAFSPDGTKVLAVQARRQFAVLDVGDGGSVTATVDLPARVDRSAAVWETNRTLLTLLRHDGEVAIVRVHLDGRIERATPVVRLHNGQSPYVIISRP